MSDHAYLETALDVLLGRSRSLVTAAQDLAEYVIRQELRAVKRIPYRLPGGALMPEYDEVCAVDEKTPPMVAARLLERIDKKYRQPLPE